MSFKSKLILLILWIIALVVINPFGEYPINDDWSYARNVYDLVVNGKFVVDLWPAMNLVSQTLYGSIFAWLFGFSFIVLRMSIFVLAIVASFVLYDLAFKLSSGKHWIALYIAISFCFSTLFCALSFTFMTDIFFLSFLIFSFNELYKFIQTGKNINYILFIVFCIIAVLNRQQGLIIPLLIIIPVFRDKKISAGNIVKAILPVFLCWLASDTYLRYLTANGIGNTILKISDLQGYLKDAPFSAHLINAGDILLVIGWLLAPLNVLLFNQFKNFTKGDWIKYLFSFFAAILIIYAALPYYPMGNISRMLEIGPRILTGNPFPLLSSGEYRILKFAITSISFISLCNSIFFMFRNKKQVQSTGWGRSFHLPLLFVTIVYFIFVSVSRAYFDRYALPLALFFLLWLIPQIKIEKLKYKAGLIIVLILLYSTALIEIKDFHNWQKERWEALAYLNRKGISSHEIDGGFEFNGWYKPNKDFSGGEKNWWWVDNDTYLLSHSKIEKYQVDSLFIVQRYLPYRKDTIFLLRKTGYQVK